MAAALMLAALGVAAAERPAAPAPAFVQFGGGDDRLAAATVGLVWPWDWQRPLMGGQLSGYWEGALAHWSVRGAQGGRSTFAMVSLVPMLRYRFDAGRSPWFVEGGIGLALTDRIFRSSERRFSTAGNFSDNLAVGHTLGSGHELSLRLLHVSNGAAKKPNPGQNLLQLRYAFSY